MIRPRPSQWIAAAEALAAALPRERLDPAVLRWVAEHAASRTPWHIALSGGADSVALLLLLYAHWPERRRRLVALHFDHRLRGAASRGDAVFCRRLCRALGVQLVVDHWRRPRTLRTPPSEGAARVARHAFFARHARVLWLAHHQDDVAETMFMRLARGSGAGGLSAPRPVQAMPAGRVHLRPLLGVPKQALLAALRQSGAAWREDETNSLGIFFRNRIRQQVIPAWVAAAQRDAIAGAARSRLLLEEDDAALESMVDRLAPLGRSGDLLLSRLTAASRAVRRRALHRWLLAIHPPVDLSRQAFDALLQAIERGKPTRQSIGDQRFAVLSAGRLKMQTGKQKRKFQRPVN